MDRFSPCSRQQDSQEFLRYLLQGLHEDVNRVQRKPTPIKIDEKAEAQMKYLLFIILHSPQILLFQ